MQDFPARRVGDRAQRKTQLIGCSLHDGSIIIRDSALRTSAIRRPRVTFVIATDVRNKDRHPPI
jgi:hypothetical protein